MASVQSGKMIVGLDIGTSKVVALVGEVTADGQLEVVGIGTHPSRGLKKGVVVNIESTVQSIQRAIDEAQQMAGCTRRSSASPATTSAASIPTASWRSAIAR